MSDSVDRKQKLLSNALVHLKSAIELLDQAAAPGHIAAHVDLAANQLEDTLARTKAAPSFRPMNENGEGCEKVSPF